MRLKITEIEATAEDLRQSNSLSDGLARLIRNAFNPYVPHVDDEDEEEDDEAD